MYKIKRTFVLFCSIFYRVPNAPEINLGASPTGRCSRATDQRGETGEWLACVAAAGVQAVKGSARG
jgi:hypothetical protein